MAHYRLIQDYDMDLISPACHPGAATWSARIALQVDITELLPLLNARLKEAEYDHGARVLVWKSEGHKYAFRPLQIMAGPAQDRDEALGLVENIVDLANQVWSGRDGIEPDFTKRAIPNLMAIYRLLPRSNCGECGYTTCMAFAAALREGKTELPSCPVLGQDAHAERLESLAAIMGVSA